MTIERAEADHIAEILRLGFDPSYIARLKKEARFALMNDMFSIIETIEGIVPDHPDWETWVFYNGDKPEKKLFVRVTEEGMEQWSEDNGVRGGEQLLDPQKLVFFREQLIFADGIDPKTHEPVNPGSAAEYFAKQLVAKLADVG